MKRKRNEEK
jgi:hypothetical protein